MKKGLQSQEGGVFNAEIEVKPNEKLNGFYTVDVRIVGYEDNFIKWVCTGEQLQACIETAEEMTSNHLVRMGNRKGIKPTEFKSKLKEMGYTE